MPFDGIFTASIVKELSTLINGRIDKIHQPARDEIMLFIKKDRGGSKVIFSANPAYPRVHITSKSRENPKVPPTFCMILRKYISGARVADVYQVSFDRIVEFKLESRDELGYPKVFYLVIEIMGKHSNIILLDEGKTIVDSVKHLDSSMNRYREVLPGVEYILPPTNNKLNPLTTGMDGFKELLSSSSQESVSRIISDSFLGISRLFAEELCGEYASTPVRELSEQDIARITSNFFYYMTKIKSGDFSSIIYYTSQEMKDYYVFPIAKYSTLSILRLESPGELLDMYYSERDTKNNLKQKYNDLFKLVSNLIERTVKKLQIHNDKLKDCSSYDTWKIYGDLLMASQYSIGYGQTKAEVENFYSPGLETISIPLDPEMNAVDNAKRYYARYAKEKYTREIVAEQLKESLEEKSYLETVLFNLENAMDISSIEEIRQELYDLGYIKKRKQSGKIQKSNPYHYRSSDGFDIYVGKNNMQNDYLTLKFAVASDIWMHTKNIPGSHVIIKSQGGRVSDEALMEGAMLAAYHSKAKSSTTVPVDYTERKNVKKPSGAKPGMVIYYTNKTIYITPDESKVSRLEMV
jgi:predicted ribosome quality control (RQC) complex YloA/Tae2 family protein